MDVFFEFICWFAWFRQVLFLRLCILVPSKGKGIVFVRKVIASLVLLCAVSGLATGAKAAETYGSIRVKLDAGDLAVTNGAVTLYQVGYRVEDGYRIAENFGGGMVRQQDADSANLAQWLAESADESGMTMLLDADGNAIFSELEEGLYILVQTERMDGFYPIRPMLLSVPQQEQWNLEIYRQPVPVVTEIPRTGQSPAPFLGILGMILSSAGLILCGKKGRK